MIRKILWGFAGLVILCAFLESATQGILAVLGILVVIGIGGVIFGH